MTRQVPTAEFASLVYGADGVPVDDPAEAFHEASRLYPNVAPGRLNTLLTLAGSPDLQQTVSRSSRTHAHRQAVDLRQGKLPRAQFRQLVAARRSELGGSTRALALRDIAAVLQASYVSSSRVPGGMRRPVPSGGALYPLELYVVALAVHGLEPCVSHYNPFRHSLEILGPIDREQARSTLVDPALADSAGALIVVTALFWRSRFKYGARGYRFALIEAGHVVQNAVLAAASLRLQSLPVGGFYDRTLDGLVGADGLDEASVYAFLLSGRK